MLTPDRAYWNADERTVRLFFCDDATLCGEYVVRGGICWPIPISETDMTVLGAAVLVGQLARTGVHYVFAEREFTSVDNTRRTDGYVENDGLAAWLNLCWAQYFARLFFVHHGETTHRSNVIAVDHSDMIRPKPAFIQAPWEDASEPEAQVTALGNAGRLKMTDNGTLMQALQRWQVDKARPNPMVHALFCAVAGMTRWPVKPRNEEEDT